MISILLTVYPLTVPINEQIGKIYIFIRVCLILLSKVQDFKVENLNLRSKPDKQIK